MRLKGLESIREGDVLAKPVYDDKCQLLLAKDAVLTESYIHRLSQANVQCVYIEDELSQGLEFENVIPDTLKIKSINTIKQAFKTLSERKSATYTVGNIDAIKDVIESLMSAIYANKDTLFCMTELMGTDMYTYNHSAEVAILSMMVAKSMGFNNLFIEKIGMGALLHDIGKMKIDSSIVHKNSELTEDEYEEMKKHPQLGYDLMKEIYNISPISRQIILLHHEKLNGVGYPLGLEESDIPVHVRVVTICDIFNAITSSRSYKKKMNADEALEVLRVESVYELDREIYHHLMKVANIYPAGTLVELSNGQLAIVVKENKEAQTRPVVQIVKSGKRAEVLDLMEHLTLFVSRTVDF
ncbi:HD domain-containing phosphohydrolase [Fusibacter tunisiensis]|uniref:Nucleotidyltransferase with HDIG domain n=1 Tax=Fusibacter tunisiensis TaxID=1008308 RepID=A0ABS2MTG0_9FIRM|nr:putative nucleotidyltransferase with HDIG domain [Fusibacter tunisiensis]